jgi:hypothetical protein
VDGDVAARGVEGEVDLEGMVTVYLIARPAVLQLQMPSVFGSRAFTVKVLPSSEKVSL